MKSITSIVSQVQSWTQNQMKENNIALGTIMRHWYKNIYEFLRLIFEKTLFVKTNLPTTFPGYKWTKTLILSVAVNWYIDCTSILNQWIYKPINVHWEHTNFGNLLSETG